jgi:hypothetical protein
MKTKKLGNSKSEPTSSKLTGKRPAKGSDDPILTYNKYGSLDDMESEGISSPKPKRKLCLTSSNGIVEDSESTSMN